MQTQSRREAINARVSQKEQHDHTPIHVAENAPPLTLREEMQRYVREQISAAAADNQAGTFEEEDDFTEDEETHDLLSNYTVTELHDEAEASENFDGKPNQVDLADSKRQLEDEAELRDNEAPSNEEENRNDQQRTDPPPSTGNRRDVGGGRET